MNVYRIDSSCYIESNVPKTEKNKQFYDADGHHLGDEFFIQKFFMLEKLIEEHDHSTLEKEAKKFKDINAHFRSCLGIDSYTLLHKAALESCHLCFQILLINGANPDIQSNQKKTAKTIAEESKKQELISLIEEKIPESISIYSIDCKLKSTFYSNQYEGSCKFGPDREDTFKIKFITKEKPFYTKNQVFEAILETSEHKGKITYEVKYDKNQYKIVFITPNLNKYKLLLGPRKTSA